MRGTLPSAANSIQPRRFIPAYAGNAHRSTRRNPAKSVHPRVCGERPHRQRRVGGQPRFIPAYAGNAPAGARWKRPPPVHPRVCGERTTCRRWLVSLSGSSPRMRGTLGTTRWRFHPRPVHPRVCGERALPRRTQPLGEGSSPRMRGTPPEARVEPLMQRFIPAYAGNAPYGSKPDGDLKVHPRVCGERRAASRASCVLSGSSPRMRGTHDCQWHGVRIPRFIPAYAGNAPV